MMLAASDAAVRAQLRDFIRTELMNWPDYPLQDDESLMSGGLLDSFCVAHLAVFIESSFGVFLADPELTVENLDCVDLIVARVLQG